MKTKLLLGSALILLSAGANAATYCVNPNKTSCDNTVQEGLDAAFAALDTSAVVVVAAGTYYEQGLIINQVGLTLKGSGKVIIDAGKTIDGSGAAAFINELSTEHSITIAANDVSLKNIGFYNNNDGTNERIGIRINNSITGVTLNKVSVVNTGASCVFADLGSNELVITNSQFKNCGIGNAAAHGIFAASNNVIIKKNTVKGAGADGIQSSGENALITKNRVERVEHFGIFSAGPEATIQSNKINSVGMNGVHSIATNAIITKNRIEGASTHGIISVGPEATIQSNKINSVGSDGIWSTDSNAIITKNRVEGAGRFGIRSTGTNAIITKNRVEGAGDDGIFSIGLEASIESNKINSVGDNGIRVWSNNQTVKSNKIKNTVGAGIKVYVGLDPSKLIKNSISESAEAGIVVADAVIGSIEIISNKVKKSRLALCAGENGGANISNFITLEADNALKGDIWVSGVDFLAADDCPELP